MPDLSQEEKDRTDFGQYTADNFFDDIGRVTQYRTSPELSERLVNRSFPTLLWMREKGGSFRPHLWPPGIQNRRPVQILGRTYRRGLGRRAGPGRSAYRRLPAFADRDNT
ncbi:hypothetical protein X735_30685 [Mesorhizobium sp. L2C085B000]|uniref:hypothetical protein n=1 Tax=unclassified Mesorhizobium TaxID=325217 RepID=UPI0003D04163|nr:hypothetical protein [Mesorhizobium sp. L2C085B000]ESZ08031.1 hypothetical protein X735_30685 [Mesorhizobium sp. L2C085B000]